MAPVPEGAVEQFTESVEIDGGGSAYQNCSFLFLISFYVVLIFSSANFISAANAVTRFDAGKPTALTR